MKAEFNEAAATIEIYIPSSSSLLTRHYNQEAVLEQGQLTATPTKEKESGTNTSMLSLIESHSALYNNTESELEAKDQSAKICQRPQTQGKKSRIKVRVGGTGGSQEREETTTAKLLPIDLDLQGY